MQDRKKIGLAAAVLFFALFVFVGYSFAQQPGYSDDELASDEISATDILEEENIATETGYSKDDLINMKKNDPQEFDRVVGQRLDHLKDLRQSNPERYQKIMERARQKKAEALERLKQENPERYKKIMERHRAWSDKWLDKKEDVLDRREDVRDHREDRQDKRENIRDRKNTPQAPRPHGHPSGGKHAPPARRGTGGGRGR